VLDKLHHQLPAVLGVELLELLEGLSLLFRRRRLMAATSSSGWVKSIAVPSERVKSVLGDPDDSGRRGMAIRA